MSHSSIVELKAELLRKQEALKNARLQSSSSTTKPSKPVQKKPSVWSKKNAGVLERAQRDLEAKQEADDVMGRSKAALEAKARLYEQMTKGNTVPDEDGSKRFLVDFEKKVIDSVLEKKQEKLRQEDEARLREEEERERQKEVEEERRLLAETVPAPEDPAEEWVDYTDSLGRSRRCLRKDLPHLQNMDKQLAPSRKGATVAKPNSNDPDLMSADMYREKLREKWEQEELEALDKPAGPLHYANVQHDEVRAHGVAYYQFDKDEESRQQQMTALDKLRQQTVDQRAKQQQVKEKRALIMKARLAKVRRRKMIREGKNPDEMESPDEEMEDSDEEAIGPKLSEKTEPELLVRDDSWRKDAPVRDWDKGKEPRDAEDWLTKQRNERVEDFAPPQFYYDSTVKIKPSLPRKTAERSQEFGPPAFYSDGEKSAGKRQSEEASCDTDLVKKLKENLDTPASVSKGLSAIRQQMTEASRGKGDCATGGLAQSGKSSAGGQSAESCDIQDSSEYSQSTRYNEDYYRQWAAYYAQYQHQYYSMGPGMPYSYPGPGPMPYSRMPYGPSPFTYQGPPGSMPPYGYGPPGPMPPRPEGSVSTCGLMPAGPPGVVPTGPPGTVPAGPPGTVPTGPPGTVPAGPPGTVPAGPPGTVPAGPPGMQPVRPPGTLPVEPSGTIGPPGTVPVGVHDAVPVGAPDTVPPKPAREMSTGPSGLSPAGKSGTVPLKESKAIDAVSAKPSGRTTPDPSCNPLLPQTTAGADNVEANADLKKAFGAVKFAQSMSSSVSPVSTEVKSVLDPLSSNPVSGLAAPQPAHFSAAPSKTVTTRRPHYQRVNLHELPSQLPAPPSTGNIPEYPSQEIIIDSKQSKGVRTEKDDIRQWQRQFQFHGSRNLTVQGQGSQGLRTPNIPFPAPNVQKKDDADEKELFPTVEFDPSKPPPSVAK